MIKYDYSNNIIVVTDNVTILLLLRDCQGGIHLANKDIRRAAGAAGIRLWQIAEKLKLTDGNFSRKLRRELPPQEKERILRIIQELGEHV